MMGEILVKYLVVKREANSQEPGGSIKGFVPKVGAIGQGIS